MSRIKGSNVTGAPIELTSAAPVDAKSIVDLKSDLITKAVWEAPSSAGANAGKMFCYFGMQVYVGGDTTENNGLYVLQNNTNEVDDASGTGANKAALKAANWVRISQTDTKIEEIKSGLEGAIATKLDKDFVTTYSQGTLEEGTVFAARSDNTADATNVYITGQQIKAFAAAAVSDKGTFSTDEDLLAAYPNPEAGWTATVLETGTTWIATEQEEGSIVWVDSEKASGVTSVNGKTGIVTLVAADIDDVYSDTETDAAISTAVSEASSTINSRIDSEVSALSGSITEVDGKVTTLNGLVSTNTESIGKINTTIGNEEGGLIKDIADNASAIEGLESSKADKGTTLAEYGIGDAYTKNEIDSTFSSVNNQISGLTSSYNSVQEQANATASALSALTTRVDTAEDDIDALEGQVSSLTTGLASVYTKTEADAKYVKLTSSTKQTIAGEVEFSDAVILDTATVNSLTVKTDDSTSVTIEKIDTELSSDASALPTSKAVSDAITSAVTGGVTGVAKLADNQTFTGSNTFEQTVKAPSITFSEDNKVVDGVLDSASVNKLFFSGYASETTVPTTAAINTIANDLAGRIHENASAISNLQSNVDDKFSALNAASINFSSGYENQSATVESEITAIKSGKADKATTIAGYGITDAYTKQEVESAIDAKIGTFVEINASFSKLEDITDPKSNIIYLIPVSDPEQQNVKEEYIWTGSAWELIGTTSVDLSGYQTKSLSSAITVDEVEQTTVEGALTAINTLAAANKAEIAGVDAKVEDVISGYVKTDSNASLTGLTVDSNTQNTNITVKSDVAGYEYGFTLAQNSMYTQLNGVQGSESVYGTLTTAGNNSSNAGKLVIDRELSNYVRTDASIFEAPHIEATSTFKVSTGGSNAFQFNTNTSSYNETVPTLEISGPNASAVVQGNVTTGGTDHGGKIIITDADVVDTASVVNVPALKDGSATAVYTSAAADTTFAKADASNVSTVASWKSKLGFVSTTGDETIAGVKTFSDGINIAGKVEKTVAGSTTQTATLSEGVTHATIRWVSASTEINYEVCIAADGEVTLLKEVISGCGENGITNIANNVITFGSEGKAYIVEYK